MVQRQSPLYETEPVYLEDQAWFLNGVVEIITALDPEMLFEKLKFSLFLNILKDFQNYFNYDHP